MLLIGICAHQKREKNKQDGGGAQGRGWGRVMRMTEKVWRGSVAPRRRAPVVCGRGVLASARSTFASCTLSSSQYPTVLNSISGRAASSTAGRNGEARVAPGTDELPARSFVLPPRVCQTGPKRARFTVACGRLPAGTHALFAISLVPSETLFFFFRNKNKNNDRTRPNARLMDP